MDKKESDERWRKMDKKQKHLKEVLDKIDKLNFNIILSKAEYYTVHSDYPSYSSDVIKKELKKALKQNG